MAIHKDQLVAAVAERAGLTKKASGEVLNAVFAAITDFVAKGETVNLVGFGKFEVVERAARTGRNFQTNETITIPATKALKFKAGKTLKAAVNK